MTQIEIQCPSCQWKPDGRAYWECHCGHVWNTFETAGRCPECGFQHNYSQCVSHAGGCNTFSPLIDWYLGLDTMVGDLLKATEPKVR